MNVTLYLLNKKGFSCLNHLLNDLNFHTTIEQVIISKDPGNKEDYYHEIKNLCLKNDIKVFDKDEKYFNLSEYSIAIGWKWLIHDVRNLIVLHDSILPKYRGFSPLPNMLIKGEKKLGVTAIYATDKMDEGDIIFQKKISIEYPVKIKYAIELVSKLYIDIVDEIFKGINFNNLPRIFQDSSKASYSIWRDENDYFIDWSKDADYIQRFVNAVGYPYDGAKTKIQNNQIIKIIEVEVIKDLKFELIHFGKIIMYRDNCPVIICGSNAIKILKSENIDGSPFYFTKLKTRLL